MAKENGIDQEELSHILRLPSWTAEQAAQEGFSAGRLYNWESKLRAKLRTAPRPADSETEAEKESARESETVSEKKSEKESAIGIETEVFGLNLQRPEERFMHDYLVRATRGQEAMWDELLFLGDAGVRRACAALAVGTTASTLSIRES